MTNRVLQAGLEERLLDTLRQVFEEELAKENLVLARPEIARLQRQVSRTVLERMLKRLGGDDQGRAP